MLLLQDETKGRMDTMAKNQKIEDKALKLSIIFLVMFSFMGIVFGFLLSSDVIFFDGIFSLFSVITSILTLQISRFIHKKDHFNFPFGKERIEPVVVIIQYLILSAFLLYSLYEAVYVISIGGNTVQLGWVILYLSITTIMLFFMVKKFREMAKVSFSSLLDSELIQWEVSLRQSVFALVSYIISLFILWLSYDEVLPYIDPIVLIFFIIITFITVLKVLWSAFKEVIGMRTVSHQFQKDIEDKLKVLVETYEIKDYYLRVSKVGSMVVVEVDFLVDKEFKFSSVYQQDLIREKFEQSLSDIEYDIWLSIAFTTQYKWMA